MTKMAVWAVVHNNYSDLSGWKAISSEFAHVEKAMKDLVMLGRQNQHVYKSWLATNPTTTKPVENDIDSSFYSLTV